MRDELKKLNCLTARNIKLYFKDKLTFFVSLITPMILIFLFLAFLKNVYEDALTSNIRIELSKNIVNAFTGGWLFSSILSVSCITVAFCSGMMVYDKINGVRNDFSVAPIKRSTIQVSYVLANFVTTLIVCLIVFAISLIYLAIVGWYLSFVQILLILANIVLTSFFGCLLANCIWQFVNSQGALSGVCTMVSSLYGFISGAYMPLGTMGKGIQVFASFLPGTYSTILFRQFYMQGVIDQISKTAPQEAIDALKTNFDCSFSFFGTKVSSLACFLIVAISTVVLLGLFILFSNLKHKTKHTSKTEITTATKNTIK